MSAMYGAVLGPNAHLQPLPSSAFDFGTGDFTVSAMVMTQAPGVVVARAGAGGSDGGFVLAVESDGSIVLATHEGSTCVQGSGESTSVLDGACHTITAIRQGTGFRIFFDGQPLTVTVSGSGGPLNVNNSLPLTIGCTQRPQPTNQFTGMVMNVGVWSTALSTEGISKAMFGRVAATDAGLQGYWTLNQTNEDVSVNANPANIMGPVHFSPCISCVWATGAQGYQFCQITNAPTSEQLADLENAGRLSVTREIQVPSGAPGLCGGIMAGGDAPLFPTGATVTLTDPSGTVHNQETNTDTAFVKTAEGQLWTFAIPSPAAGTWHLAASAPAATVFTLNVATLPRSEVVPSVEGALLPLYGPDALAPEHEGHDLGGWFETFVAVAVGAVVAGAVLGIAMMTAGSAIPAVVAVVAPFAEAAVIATGLALGTVVFDKISVANGQIAGMSGFVGSNDTILLIDQNVDDLTQLLYARRSVRLYARVTASKFRKKSRNLVGDADTRPNVSAALSGFSSGFVSSASHGEADFIFGWFENGVSGAEEKILAVGGYQAVEPRGKIIHLMACEAGASLGPDLVRNGAVAVFGYNHDFILAVEEADTFFDCDMEIDFALIEGRDCDEAYAAAIAAMNNAIALFTSENKLQAAGYMQQDRDRLVAPSTGAAYGSKNAKIN